MSYSVVIPAYNAADTLKRAVMSCIHQRLIADAIIIVDDASGDDTYTIAKSLAEQYSLIKVISLSKNAGVSVARNIGWKQVSSDYVAFLDSDDEWHPAKMQICMEFCIEDNLPMLWHDYSYNQFQGSLPRDVSINNTTFASLLLQSPIATCAIVVKSDTAFRFDEKMRYCEDHDFLLRFSYRYTIMHYPVPLSLVHRKINSPGGLSGQIWKMRKGEIYMYTKLTKLNPLFLIIIPFMILFSLFKHLRLLTKQK